MEIKKEDIKRKARPVKTKADLEMLREKRYERYSHYGGRNICDNHEDGA